MADNQTKIVITAQDATRAAFGSVKGNLGSLSTAAELMKSALGALGIGLGVGYFTSIIKGTIDSADHLNDLSKSTSIAVEQLAGLKLAAAQTGGDLDSIGASINKLSVNMGKDAEKFAALGISAKDPLQAFKQLADVFNLLQDPQQRAAVAAAALGKSWAGAAPLLAEGSAKIQKMVDKGTLLSGMTKEMAAAADEFNDAMAELGVTLSATRNKLVGEMLPGMNDIARAMQEAAKEGGLLTTIWVGLGGAFAAIIGATDSQKLKAQLAQIDEELAAARKRLASSSVNPPGASNSFFAFLIPDIKLGESAIVQLRATIDRLERERARLAPAKTPAAGPDPAAAARAAAAAAAFLNPPKEPGPVPGMTEHELQVYANAVKAVRELEQVGKQINDDLAEQDAARYDLAVAAVKELESIKAQNKEVERQAQYWRDIADPMQPLQREMAQISELYVRGSLSAQDWAAASIKVGEKMDALSQDSGKLNDIGRDFGLTMISALGRLISEGGKASDIIKSLGRDMAQIITKISILQPLEKSLESAFKGGSMMTDLLSSLGIGGPNMATLNAGYEPGGIFRAAGGPVSGGHSYIVGERGPELFTPGASGSITPNGAFGGTVNQFSVDMRGATVEAVARLERLVASVNGSIEQRALSVFGQARARGAI